MSRDPLAGQICQSYRYWGAISLALGVTWALFSWLLPEPGDNSMVMGTESGLGLLMAGCALVVVLSLGRPRPLCFWAVQAMQVTALGLFILDNYWHPDGSGLTQIGIQFLALGITCWPRMRRALSGGEPWGGWPGRVRESWRRGLASLRPRTAGVAAFYLG